jgi:dipeptidyl aminopeptidase/acylaminoacyl peptidase
MPDTLEKSVREWRKKKWDQAIEDERLQFSHVWVTELATGKRRRLTSEPIFLWNLRWSPDSKRLAFITSPSGKPDDSNLQDIGVVPVEGGSIRELGVIGTSFERSPDSRWIALATASDRKVFVQPNDLWVVPADGGAARNLTVRFDGDVDTPCWSRGSDTLFFHAPQGVTSRVAAIPLHGGGVSLFNDRAAEAGTPVAARDGRIAWVQSQPEHPSEVWIAERPTAAGRAVTSINAAVAKLALGATRTVHWTSSDGVKIEGVLLRPPGAAERGPLKTLVLLHGGPYGARFGLGFQAAQQYFAAAGYQVFMPNFRSSSGYGADFLVRQRSDWGGQDWRDVMSGVDSLVASGLADGARLGVYGGSYGGYLSAWAITQTHRFDAASVSAGAVDLAAHYGQSDIHQYRAFDFGGPPWVTPENWRRASPITYIARARTPTLILVGESDARVPYPQSQELYTALHTLGVPVEFVHYPREGHGLREPRHRADQYTRMLAWFDRWVK